MKNKTLFLAVVFLLVIIQDRQAFATLSGNLTDNTGNRSPEYSNTMIAAAGCFKTVNLSDMNSYDFSAGTASSTLSSGDFYLKTDGGAKFWADNDSQGGLLDLGNIGDKPFSHVAIPASGYIKTGIAVVTGHTYVSRAQTGEEDNFIIFKVTNLTSISVTMEYSYQHRYRITLEDGMSYDFSAHEIMGYYNYGDLYFDGYDLTFKADNSGQNGILSLGNIGNTPLNKLSYPESGYTRYGVQAIECHTYVSLAQAGEEGNYIFFRVQQVSVDSVTIDYFYRDKNLFILADAGTDQSVIEGDLVTLDGSASRDPGGKPLTYKWTAPEGITLSSDTVVNPTFTAPPVTGSTNDKYVFYLVVSNGTETSYRDNVVVIVKKYAVFAGGSGTAEDPWLIATPEQLNFVRYRLDGHFKQIADIDLGVSPWTSGTGWLPIGTFGDWQTGEGFFTGSYDGGGYRISNLTINTDLNYTGLFGASWSVGSTYAEFRNIRLADVNIRSSGSNTGGIIGDLDYRSKITACSVTGIIETQAGWVGGIAGVCINSASVEQCFFNGKVSGTNYVGGLLGQIANNCTLRNSYATGEVSGVQYVGGACGQLWNPKVLYCYSGCKVTGTSNVGGFAGSSYNSTVTSCYWDTENSGLSASAAGVGKTTAQMVTKSTFAGWNFVLTWKIDEKNSYPYLLWQGTPGPFNYPVRHAPVAIAGPDQTVDEGMLVTLDGSASSDPDNDPITYTWTAPAGITLSSNAADKPTFIAPEVSTDTPLEFSLTVSDGINISPADKVVVTVLNRFTDKHFVPVWSGPGIDLMNINVVKATLDGMELEPGDEIALFDDAKCVGMARISATIDSLHVLNIKVSRDDGSGNGYTSGHPITYMYWDYSAGKEISGVAPDYLDDNPAWSVSGNYEPAALAFVRLSFATVLNQTVNLNIGWNIFSTNVTPPNPDMKALFQTLIDQGKLIKIQDEKGSALEDLGFLGGWTNFIGDIALTEGYKVKVTQNCQVTFTGKPATLPYEIPLKAGWNIMGFPQLGEADGLSVVQQLIDRDKLIKVQDEKGNSIEDLGVFGGWFNFIGNFKPGEGYKIKVKTDEILTIYESYTKSSATPMSRLIPVHFIPAGVGNGVDHMNINLVNLPATLDPGDEIGIFDGDLCVGSAAICNLHSQIRNVESGTSIVSIAVTADDFMGEYGFTEKHPFSIKVWKAATDKEYLVEPKILKGTPLFVKHESVVVSLENLKIRRLDDLMIDGSENVRVYPNPTEGKVFISAPGGIARGLKVQVVNTLGQVVLNQVLENDPGMVDLSGFVNGIYHIRVSKNGWIKSMKIILK